MDIPPPSLNAYYDQRIVKDAVYRVDEAAPERGRLDLYLPPSGVGPWPLLLYIHGGGWNAFSKGEGHHARPFTRYGMAVAVINYRYSSQAPFPAQLDDCRSAIRWLHERAEAYGLRRDAVVAWGDSAGGHLAMMLAVTARHPSTPAAARLPSLRGAISHYGGSDLLKMEDHWREGRAGPGNGYAWAVECLSQLLGAPLYQSPHLARAASPICHVERHAAPPLLLLHGTADEAVSYRQSVAMAEACQAAGVPVTLQLYEGAGHGGPEFVSAQALDLTLSFLRRCFTPCE